MADLVADAKKRPGEITYSSSGNYGASHVPFEMFSQAAGIKMLHVPYRGGGPALVAFVGGQVDLTRRRPVSSIRRRETARRGSWRIGARSAPKSSKASRP